MSHPGWKCKHFSYVYSTLLCHNAFSVPMDSVAMDTEIYTTIANSHKTLTGVCEMHGLIHPVKIRTCSYFVGFLTPFRDWGVCEMHDRMHSHQIRTCNYFVGSWPPSLIGVSVRCTIEYTPIKLGLATILLVRTSCFNICLPYYDPSSSGSKQYVYENSGC